MDEKKVPAGLAGREDVRSALEGLRELNELKQESLEMSLLGALVMRIGNAMCHILEIWIALSLFHFFACS